MSIVGCAYCGEHSIFVEKISLDSGFKKSIDVHIRCGRCGKEDLAAISGDYLIWVICRLLPIYEPSKVEGRISRRFTGEGA